MNAKSHNGWFEAALVTKTVTAWQWLISVSHSSQFNNGFNEHSSLLWGNKDWKKSGSFPKWHCEHWQEMCRLVARLRLHLVYSNRDEFFSQFNSFLRTRDVYAIASRQKSAFSAKALSTTANSISRGRHKIQTPICNMFCEARNKPDELVISMEIFPMQFVKEKLNWRENE